MHNLYAFDKLSWTRMSNYMLQKKYGMWLLIHGLISYKLCWWERPLVHDGNNPRWSSMLLFSCIVSNASSMLFFSCIVSNAYYTTPKHAGMSKRWKHHRNRHLGKYGFCCHCCCCFHCITQAEKVNKIGKNSIWGDQTFRCTVKTRHIWKISNREIKTSPEME